ITIIAAIVAIASAGYRAATSPAYYGYAPALVPKAAYAIPHAAYADPKADYVEPFYKPQPYSFGYNIDDGYGNNNFQNEEGDEHGGKRGSYGYTDAHGVYRKVDYIADNHGFRASISTNEPGTSGADPADVKMQAKDAPAKIYAAPAFVAPAYVAYRAPYHGPGYGHHGFKPY
ncbi:Cuticle protein 16.8-like protein, partial [Dinothrombium tinctorium]